MQRARQPRFPVGIQPCTFELVEDMLRKLQYSGPVALSCDDTKLLASFRPFYDEDRKGYFVMGHTGDPYELVDHQAFQRVVGSQELTKATKVNYSSNAFTFPEAYLVLASTFLSTSAYSQNTNHYCRCFINP